MKVRLLYTQHTLADRDIDYFVRQLEGAQIAVEMINADSRDGAALSELYDALDRPAIIVTNDDGVELQKWQGQLPRLDDVMALAGRA